MTKSAAPLTKKRADKPAQYNGIHHMTNMPNHPRTHGAGPTERSVPDTRHRTAATTRQVGQQNTSHINTEAAYKPTQPKMAGLPKCNHQVQPDSQADPAMHHPAHHHAQGKDATQ
ncbi:hypothetical protein ILYODFUR_007750 [Ilyodon furcidens]|uniref:Uncharacterized protein n=1 Tax=Ilyodon furcidens TaxID=33524 RepID=A0ABV0TJA6_9TELE